MACCNGKLDDNGKENDSQWRLDGDLISRVEVKSAGRIIEIYDFSYDEESRLASIVKRDIINGGKILDLKLTYPEATKMEMNGRYHSEKASRKLRATVDASSSCVSYTGNWEDAWTFKTMYDANGTVLSTGAEHSYTSNNYNAQVSWSERCSVNGGDVTSVETGTSSSVKTAKNSRSTAQSSLRTDYIYGEHKDNCNFNVFLMNCEFPVWMAKGLPGCSHLITEMSCRSGSTALPSSFKMSYTFDESGKMVQAVRKDYEGNSVIMERTYTLKYQ